jgi:phosphatidylglycerol:prolipoprotein diacylglycerol transferase
MPFLAIPYPKINPVAIGPFGPFGPFDLGPLGTWGPFSPAIQWYGLAYIAGLLLGWYYIKRLLGQNELWPKSTPPFAQGDTDDLLIYVAGGVLLGGRLGYVLFYEPQKYLESPLELFAVWNGGMAFHGGLIGSIVAIWLFSRAMKANPWSTLDACAAAVPIGLFFGRLANFVNGELWGRQSSVAWAMAFPRDPAHLERHPSQLYEAALEGLVLFSVLWWLAHKAGALRRPGVVAGTFLMGYGLARSFCELFREPDHPGHIFNSISPFLTAGIVYSIPMIVAGAWILREAVRRTPAAAVADAPSAG